MEDESYAQLIENSIREHFERNGTLDEMRSGLHVKVLKMLHSQMKIKKNGPLCGGNMEQRGQLRLLNQLIVDYFDWFGYKHTLETFALETGGSTKPKSREKLQQELNSSFDNKKLPILLQMLMVETTKVDDLQLDKVKTQPAASPRPLKKLTPRSPLVQELKAKPNQKNVDKLVKETPSKSGTPIRLIKQPQMKVYVRQSMAEGNRSPNRTPRNQIQPKPEEKKINKYSSDTESSSEATKSSSDYETDDNSDNFDDIPNRYYYREQEPPETTYPKGFGEEGHYEGKYKMKMGNASSPGLPKRKGLKIVELVQKDKEKPQGSVKDKPTKAKLKAKRCKYLFQAQRRGEHPVEETKSPVSKPKCPETMVSAMDSDESSDEDSDVYL